MQQQSQTPARILQSALLHIKSFSRTLSHSSSKPKIILLCLFILITLYLRSTYNNLLASRSTRNRIQSLPTQVVAPREFEVFPGFIRINHLVCADQSTKHELPLRRCYGLRPHPRNNSTRFPTPNDMKSPSPFVHTVNDPNLLKYWEKGEILYYQPALTEIRSQKSIDLIRDFFGLLNLLNGTAWPAAGTFLGSLRHSDRIPWDDDIDLHIMMVDFLPIFGILDAPNHEYIEGVSDHLNSRAYSTISNHSSTNIAPLHPDYYKFSHKGMGRAWWLKHKDEFTPEQMRKIRYYQRRIQVFGNQAGSCAKIFYRDDAATSLFQWGFPFMDLYCWMIDFESSQFKFLYRPVIAQFSDIMPLQYRPYGEIRFAFTNRLAYAMTALVFKDVFERCITSEWDHANEFGQHTSYGVCSHFHSVYPFIRHRAIVTINLAELPPWLVSRLHPTNQITIETLREHHDDLQTLASQSFKTTLEAEYVPPPPQAATRRLHESQQSSESKSILPTDVNQTRQQSSPIRGEVDGHRPRGLVEATSSTSSTDLFLPGVLIHPQQLNLEDDELPAKSSLRARTVVPNGGVSNANIAHNDSYVSHARRYGLQQDFSQEQLRDLSQLYSRLHTSNPNDRRLIYDPLTVDVTIEEIWMGANKIQTNLLFGGDYSALVPLR